MEKESVKALSSLTLAYLGDAVFELMVRERLVESGGRPSELSREASHIVCASAQSRMIESLLPDLTDEEEEVYRRGRNAHSPTTAKNQTIGDYRRATGFEALAGYLYLRDEKERLTFLVEKGLENLKAGRAGQGEESV